MSALRHGRLSTVETGIDMLPSQVRSDTTARRQGGKPRIVFLGGCHVDGLARELHADFECVQFWRRPTIALMSEPVPLRRALDFEDRQSRYIVRDCAKTHLQELRSISGDIFVFEIVRDVRCPLVRIGHRFLFDPNQMHRFIPDALDPSQRAVDLEALLGVAAAEPFEAQSETFLAVWSEAFARFYDSVLKPRLDRGGTVMLMQVFLAKHTFPPSEALQDQWAYCDAMNALLRKMYAHARGFAGIQTIGVDETLCLSASDALYGAAITHLLPDIFTLIAGQARDIIASGRRGDLSDALFALLLHRTGQYQASVTARNEERHELNLEILRLREQRDYDRARHAWELRRIENRRPTTRMKTLLKKLSRFASPSKEPRPSDVGQGLVEPER